MTVTRPTTTGIQPSIPVSRSLLNRSRCPNSLQGKKSRCAFSFCACTDSCSDKCTLHRSPKYQSVWNEFLQKIDPYDCRQTNKPRICSCHFPNGVIGPKITLRNEDIFKIIKRLNQEKRIYKAENCRIKSRLSHFLNPDQFKIVLDEVSERTLYRRRQKEEKWKKNTVNEKKNTVISGEKNTVVSGERNTVISEKSITANEKPIPIQSIAVWSDSTIIQALKILKLVPTKVYDEIIKIIGIPFPSYNAVHHRANQLETGRATIKPRTRTNKSDQEKIDHESKSAVQAVNESMEEDQSSASQSSPLASISLAAHAELSDDSSMSSSDEECSKPKVSRTVIEVVQEEDEPSGIDLPDDFPPTDTKLTMNTSTELMTLLDPSLMEESAAPALQEVVNKFKRAGEKIRNVQGKKKVSVNAPEAEKKAKEKRGKEEELKRAEEKEIMMKELKEWKETTKERAAMIQTYVAKKKSKMKEERKRSPGGQFVIPSDGRGQGQRPKRQRKGKATEPIDESSYHPNASTSKGLTANAPIEKVSKESTSRVSTSEESTSRVSTSEVSTHSVSTYGHHHQGYSQWQQPGIQPVYSRTPAQNQQQPYEQINFDFLVDAMYRTDHAQ